jgi:hypothetical protein
VARWQGPRTSAHQTPTERVAWSSDAKLSAARAMSAFDTIQLLRERTTLDAQTRQSLLNELGSSIAALPASDFPQVLEFCGKLLEGDSAIDRVIGLRTTAAVCAQDPSLITPALCQQLGRSSWRAPPGSSGELAGELCREGCGVLVSCLQSSHRAAGSLLHAAPTVVGALLDCLAIPSREVLADASLRREDARITPLCDVFKALYEVLPDARRGEAEPEAEEPAVGEALGRVCATIMAVCEAESRRAAQGAAPVFALMNSAWRLLLRLSAAPPLLRLALSPPPQLPSEIAELPSRLQACVLAPVRPSLLAALRALRSDEPTEGAAGGGAAGAEVSVKVALFGLGQLRGFCHAYGGWAAAEAARGSASTVELGHGLAALLPPLLAATQAAHEPLYE